jgi:hypothetical protein
MVASTIILKPMKIIYIAHPITGNVKSNVEKVVSIAREINLSHPHICPIAPNILDLQAMNPDVLTERNRGVRNGIELIERKVMDEIWFYGEELSKGMRYELMRATELGIPVIPKSESMKKIFFQMWTKSAA